MFFFSPTNSPEPNDSSLTVRNDEDEQLNHHIQDAGSRKVNLLSEQIESLQLYRVKSSILLFRVKHGLFAVHTFVITLSEAAVEDLY